MDFVYVVAWLIIAYDTNVYAIKMDENNIKTQNEQTKHNFIFEINF